MIFGLTACGEDGIKVNSTNALARKLASDSAVKINVSKDIVLDEPIVVNGVKEIVGSGKIVAAVEGNEELYMITVADGGKLTIGGSVKIDASGLMGAVHVQKGGTAVVKDKAVVKNASILAANALVEGTLEVQGGNLKAAKGHNVINKNTTTISGGKVTGSGEKYAGVYNEATLTQSSGKVSAAYNNISNMKGSTFTFEGGSNEDSIRDGVFIAEGATLKATNKDATIVNAGARGILLQGKADIKVITVKECGDTLVKVAKTGVLNLGNGILQGGNYHGVDNAGTMNMLGGNISLNANCGIVNTGTLKVSSGNISENANKGILNKHEGKADVTSAMVTFTSNKTAIANEDKAIFEFAKAKLLMSTQTNIYCYDGTMNIHDASLNASTSNNVRIVDGVINMTNVEVKGNSQKSNTSHHGIYMEGGVINAENVTVSMTTGHGIRNKGGVFKGKNIIMHDINRVAVSQGKHDYLKDVEGLTEIDNLEVQSTNYANVYNEGGGTIKITNGKLAVATSNSVRSNDGKMELTNVTIPGHKEGSKNNIHGIYMEGGEIVANNVTVKNTSGYGLRNLSGKFVGTNIKMTNLGRAGVNNSKRTKDGVTVVATTSIDGLTINKAGANNVLLDAGAVTIKNGVLGKVETVNHNVKVTNTSMLTMNHVEIRGTTTDKRYVLIAEKGGCANLTDVIITDAPGNAIHINHKDCLVTGKNVTVKNCKNAAYSSAGTIKIENLTTENIANNNILVKGTGSVIAIDSKLGATKGHNIKSETGAMVTLKSTVVEGTAKDASGDKRAIMAEGGAVNLENVTIQDARIAAIHSNKATSKVVGEGVVIKECGRALTGTKGTIKITGLTTENIKNNNIMAGTDDKDAKETEDKCVVTITNGELCKTTSGHNVKSTLNGKVVLMEVDVYGTASDEHRGIIAEKGSSMKLTSVKVQDVTGINDKGVAMEALYSNHASNEVIAEDVTIENCNIGISATAGSVKVTTLKTNNIEQKNVVASGTSTIEIVNGDLCVTPKHNTHSNGAGSLLSLENVTINGVTSSNQYGIIAEKGGDVEVKDVTVKNVNANALHINNAESEIRGTDVTVSDAKNGITGSKGKVDIKGFIVNAIEKSVNASGSVEMILADAEFGKTSKHNVDVTGGTVTLNNAQVLGTTVTSGTVNGIHLTGANTVINATDVTVQETLSAAIRVSDGTLNGTNVTVQNIANSSGVQVSSGTVIIDGYTATEVANNAISVYSSGQVTVKNAMVTGGKCALNNDGSSKPVTVENFESTGQSDYGIFNKGILNIAGVMKTNIYNDKSVTVSATKDLVGSDMTIDWTEGKEPTGLVGIQFASEADMLATKSSVDANETKIELGSIQKAKYVPRYFESQMILSDPQNALYKVTKYEELKTALDSIKANDETKATITIAGDIIVPETIEIEAGRDITLVDDETARIIKRADSFKSNAKMFNVSAGGRLTLKSSSLNNSQIKLTVDGGKTNGTDSVVCTGNSQLIYTAGTVVVTKGVELTNNECSGDISGVGIYAVAGSNTTFSGKLTNMQETKSSSNFNRGNAVTVTGANAKMTIQDALISDNDMNNTAGIIWSTEGAELTMTDSTFSNNSSVNSQGGVLRVDANSGKVEITGCTFTGNEATKSNGGVMDINATSADVIISDCTITNNTAKLGGAITLANNAKLKLIDCTFTGNTATDGAKGNDIRVGGANSKLYLSGKITAEIFNDRASKIYVNGNLTEGSVVVVDWNTSYDSNGMDAVIFDSEAIMTASRNYITLGKLQSADYSLKFSGTKATLKEVVTVTTEQQLRDAITNASDKVALIKLGADINVSGTITVPAEYDVSIQDDGTARTIKRAATFKADAKLFDVAAGGTLTLKSTSLNNGQIKLTVDGGRTSGIDSVVCTGNSQLIYTAGTVVVTKGVELTNNECSGDISGVGIYAAAGSNTTFSGKLTNMQETKSSSSFNRGNAITVTGANAKMTIQEALISDNDMNNTAGVIWSTAGAELTMTDSTFSNNSSVNSQGGVLRVDANSGKVEITGCTFTGNEATKSNGGVMDINATSADVIVSDCTFTNNTAKLGGAITLANNAKLKLIDCTFSGNTATDGAKGNDIRVGGANSKLYLSGKITAEIFNDRASKIYVNGNLTGGSQVVVDWNNSYASNNMAAINFDSETIMNASKDCIELGPIQSATRKLSFSGKQATLVAK